MRLDNIQDVCEDIVADVDGAMACALVDIQTGLPLTLRVKTNTPFDAGAMELLSAAGVAYFSGDEPALAGDALIDDAVQEIQTTTEDAYYFMSRVPGDVQELLILVTDRKTTNLGLGWMSVRRALAHIQAMDEGGDGATGDAEPAHAAPPAPEPSRPDDATFAMRSRDRRSIWG